MAGAVDRDALWSGHDLEWRDPAELIARDDHVAPPDPALLAARAYGDFWDLLAQARATLLVTREYEHLVLALTAAGGRPRQSHLRIAHPSGLVADRERGVVHLASTRNPNQVYEMAPALPSGDDGGAPWLLPVTGRFLPGRLYLHDLALVGGRLHGNAVGLNAVVTFGEHGRTTPVWWPRVVDTPDGPDTSRNYLQLNSIAAGADLASSFFSASGETVSRRRPGHRNYPVDRRGVVFSGRTREPVVRGLTRPHSARLMDGALWVDDSGYGEVGVVDDGRFEPVARLDGWTRGLCRMGDVALVGTSRVIPRFRQYAPGLDVERSVCGVHAIDMRTGEALGGLVWPNGNQIFAIDWLPDAATAGFPFDASERRRASALRRLFYSFQTTVPEED